MSTEKKNKYPRNLFQDKHGSFTAWRDNTEFFCDAYVEYVESLRSESQQRVRELEEWIGNGHKIGCTKAMTGSSRRDYCSCGLDKLLTPTPEAP